MYSILDTKIKGKAVFATKVFVKDEFIGEYYKNTPIKEYPKNIYGWYDRELGRYCNHSNTPNTYVKETINLDGYDLYANCNINVGDEIVVDYVFMEILTNAPAGVFYKQYFNNIILKNFGNNYTNYLI